MLTAGLVRSKLMKPVVIDEIRVNRRLSKSITFTPWLSCYHISFTVGSVTSGRNETDITSALKHYNSINLKPSLFKR